MADYEASQAGSNTADTGAIARPDVDSLPAGSMSPASGIAITGAGTVTGSAGADTPDASIVEVHGAGGATGGGAGNFQANGQYGVLSMDAQGNYNYVRNPGTPDGVRDVFGYTVANAQGANASSTLTIDIGQVLTANAGIVNLPAGVELSDIHVVGRDLVIDMPDGTHMVIPNGAVFVPQLSIGDVSVPASNVAALLIDSEPQPAAGPPQSSGGNFAADVPPLDPGVPLGDLIPPTELGYIPPEFRPEGGFIDREPTVVIVTPDNPAGAVAAHDQVSEAGLPARTIDGAAEPEGSNSAADVEGTAGTIVFVAQDGLDSVTVNGVEITSGSVGQTIQGEFGVLTITSVNLANGQIGYTYAISDNTDPGGDGHHDDFSVVVTDSDGDVATATLTIDIVDDTPTARNDTDSVDVQTHIATGNVVTAVGTTNSGADTVGADNAHVSGVSSNNVAGHSDNDASGGFVVVGQFGTLTMNADGSYSYVLNENAPGGSSEVFTYTLTDGDGDTSTATLTINNPDHTPTVVIETPDNPAGAVNASESVNEKGLPERSGEPAGSGEIADGNGTNNSDGSETNTGTIVFSSQDGVAGVSVNGTAITSVGQVIHGAFGDMTITSINLASGEIGYSYTLLDNTSGNSTHDDFTVVVTDTDGDTATGHLVVNIIDDVPTARNDTDAVDLQTHSAAGNVITAVGTTNSGADTVGADNAAVSGVSSNNVAGHADNDATGGFVVVGEFGTLTMNPDGSYTYVLNEGAPGGSVEVFTYTLTDGDGDTSTATLTINNPDHTPTIEIVTPDNPAGAVNATESVDEKGLPARTGENEGSGEQVAAGANGDTSETNTGTIQFSSEDGVASVSVNGTAVTSVGQVIHGAFGDMTITSINMATGQIGYSYTLLDNTGGNNTHDDFAVVVTDTDGDTAAGSLQVNIIDDVPDANNDTDSSDAVTRLAQGNVITGASTDGGTSGSGVDLPGADSGKVSAVVGFGGSTDSTLDGSDNLQVNGHYGTLVLNADGTYTYTANEGAPGGASDVFTYTLTDSDGDTSTATLTITIADHTPTIDIVTPDNPNGAVNATESVNEKGLPARAGENEGSGEQVAAGANGDTSETNTGTIQFSSEDGVASVTVNGTAITSVGQIIHGAFGDMTITSINLATGQIGYSYTLLDNTSGDTTHDDFSVVVTDNDGDTASATLKVNIIDDAPDANNDTDTANSAGVATGNVITGASTDGGTSGSGVDLPGADSGKVSAVVGFGGSSDNTLDGSGNLQVNGHYGTLVLNADGSYTYTANAGVPGGASDVFTYTLTDSDGDTSTATLTITTADHAPTIDIVTPDNPNGAVNATESVNEKGLPARAGENEGSGEQAAAGANGDTSETNTGTIQFNSTDGVASVSVNGTAVTSVGQVIHGAFGDMTITSINMATGQIGYSYTLLDNTSGNTTHDDFAVKVTDLDGDTANATLTVNIVDDVPTAHNDTDSLAAGTYGPEGGNVITGVGTTSSPGGIDVPGADSGKVSAVVGFGGSSDNTLDGSGNLQVNGHYGTLVLNADGTYSYTRNADAPGGVSDVFTYTLTDSDGDTSTATLTITIGDTPPTLDVPTTGEAGTSVNEAGLPVRAGENEGSGEQAAAGANGDPSERTDGTINFTSGDAPASVTIDGAGLGGPVVITAAGQTVVGAFGTLTIDSYNAATGAITYHYILADNTSGNTTHDDFSVIVTDADGDTASATLRIDIVDDVPTAHADTDAVASGSYAPEGGNVITGVGTTSSPGGIDVPGADSGKVSAVVGFGGSTDSSLDGSGNLQVNGHYGTLVLNADGTYVYTRNAGTPGGVSDVFTYTLTDSDGDTSTATLTITIGNSPPDVPTNINVGLDDDALTGGNPGTPAVNDDPDSVNATGSIAATGGDGPIAYSLLATGAPAGFTYSPQGNGDIWVLQGLVHVLTVHVDGSTGAYSVTQVAPIDHPTGDLENNDSFTLTFKAVDQDGQSDTGTFTISVDDDTPINFNPVDVNDKTLAAPHFNDALQNDGTAVATRALNDTNNDSIGEKFIGADGFAASNGLVFTVGTHTNGEALKDTGGHALLSHGNAILLNGFGTNTLVAYTESGAHAGYQAGEDHIVFTASLAQGAGNGENSSYTIDFDDTIDDGSQIHITNFGGVKGGQHQWADFDSDGGVIDADNNNSPDILLTPTKVGGSVNTSATDIGSSNQWIGATEGIRVDYVTDVRTGSGDESVTGGYTFDGHYTVTSSSFQVMQVKSGGASSIQITAYNDSDGGTLTDLTGAKVTIDPSSIVVTGDATYTVVVMPDGSVVITGLEAGAIVSFDTNGAPYNAIGITDAAGVANPNGGTFSGDDFALGNFGYGAAGIGQDIDMSFGVTATDHDGDTSTGTIDVSLVPAGTVESAAAINSLMATSSLQSTDSSTSNTHHLVSTNDNHRASEHYRVFEDLRPGVAALAGAIAGAGLLAQPLAAEHPHANHGVFQGGRSGPIMAPGSLATQSSAHEASAHSAALDAHHVAAGSHLMATTHLSAPAQAASLHGLAGHAPAPQMHAAPLLGGSEGHVVAQHAMFTSAGISIPSAQMLATHGAPGVGKAAPDAHASVGGAQTNAVVGQVLADSLAGGQAHGPNIDTLLHNVAGLHGHGADAHSVLASQALADVSIGHSGSFAGFASGHGAPIMHVMMMHHDATPAHT